ncbi:hypothetical protein FE772_16895 [Lysobacter enzymogenes]|nr:hypothetical protein FE772_16895 [Lysobacter enzymogenes]
MNHGPRGFDTPALVVAPPREAPIPQRRTESLAVRPGERARIVVRARAGERFQRHHVYEKEKFMKRTMMKVAAAVFAVGLVGGVGVANAQIGGAYCNPNGATTNIVQGSWRNYYTCSNHKWVFVKACPVGGGRCVF